MQKLCPSHQYYLKNQCATFVVHLVVPMIAMIVRYHRAVGGGIFCGWPCGRCTLPLRPVAMRCDRSDPGACCRYSGAPEMPHWGLPQWQTRSDDPLGHLAKAVCYSATLTGHWSCDGPAVANRSVGVRAKRRDRRSRPRRPLSAAC